LSSDCVSDLAVITSKQTITRQQLLHT